MSPQHALWARSGASLRVTIVLSRGRLHHPFLIHAGRLIEMIRLRRQHRA